MLEAECRAAGVRIETGRSIRSVARADSFEVVDDRDSWRAGSLVIATGGSRYRRSAPPRSGSAVAEQFGLQIVERRPALVPLTFGPDDQTKFGDLAGVSCGAVVRAGGRSFREKMLFTHRGLSGPAVLQASTYWKPGGAVEVDLLPDVRRGGRYRAAAIGGRPVADSHAARRVASPSVWPTAGAKCMAPPSQLRNRQPRGCAIGGESPRLAIDSIRHRRLRQGRGHRRGCRHPRIVLPDDGGGESPRTLLHRRGSRRPPANSAASTSNGHGLPGQRPDSTRRYSVLYKELPGR